MFLVEAIPQITAVCALTTKNTGRPAATKGIRPRISLISRIEKLLMRAALRRQFPQKQTKATRNKTAAVRALTTNH